MVLCGKKKRLLKALKSNSFLRVFFHAGNPLGSSNRTIRIHGKRFAYAKGVSRTRVKGRKVKKADIILSLMFVHIRRSI